METNIILAGVGGQGILSISVVIDMTALQQGLHFKQSEVHGMSQRGGEVQSHLRVADHPLHSDLVPRGRGTLILSVEPLESLRYLDYLSPEGAVVTGVDPMINITDYPDPERLLEAVGEVPHAVLVPAERLARQAGSARAQNMVLLGAASPYLGLREEVLEGCIGELFARKGERVQRINQEAFRSGLAAGRAYRACREAGIGARETRTLLGRLAGGALAAEAVSPWRELLQGEQRAALVEVLGSEEKGTISGGAALPRALLAEVQPTSDRLREILFARGA